VAIQLTPEQEQRIQAVFETGAYPSTEEALDAAVAAVEAAATPGFEGSQEELQELLRDGIHSGEPVEADEAFWDRLRTQTARMGGTPGAEAPSVRIGLSRSIGRHYPSVPVLPRGQDAPLTNSRTLPRM